MSTNASLANTVEILRWLASRLSPVRDASQLAGFVVDHLDGLSELRATKEGVPYPDDWIAYLSEHWIEKGLDEARLYLIAVAIVGIASVDELGPHAGSA